MNTLHEIMHDKLINGFLVALILGISTINSINNIGGMILDHVLGVATTPWNWKIFYGQITLYATAIIAAVLIRRRASRTSPPNNISV